MRSTRSRRNKKSENIRKRETTAKRMLRIRIRNTKVEEKKKDLLYGITLDYLFCSAFAKDYLYFSTVI
jgi:hypothetical protein